MLPTLSWIALAVGTVLCGLLILYLRRVTIYVGCSACGEAVAASKYEGRQVVPCPYCGRQMDVRLSLVNKRWHVLTKPFDG